LTENNLENQTAETPAPVEAEKKNNSTTDSRHDDFDWNTNKKNVRSYSDDERNTMKKQYDGTFVNIENDQILHGQVVSITNNDVVLNVGFKSDGLVPLSEFRDIEGLKVGDAVEVLVVEKENPKGQLILSRKNAKLVRSWERIVDAHRTGIVVMGTITSKTKGGLIVEVFDMETFLPGSQIDVKPITDYDMYVGQTMEFKVVKINELIKNAVVSHKALIESDIEQQRAAIMGKLEKGQVLEGTIKNITDFGAFIDLGGVDGLLYITDISWGRINHPKEVLELNQKLNVVVLDYDDEKKRISLGLKQLTPQPWDTLDPSVDVGSHIKGKIVNIEDYGAFLEIIPGVEGLIHVSEVSWSNTPINSKEFFKSGEELETVVVTIDRAERKMSLSLKQLSKDPWSDIETKYPVNSKQKGIVRNISAYGVFVELEPGITGFVHVSDLSWVKRIHHPNEFTKVGNEMEVMVLEIDKENRKLSLGHRQVEEDPWNTFETLFPVGSVHQATVIKRDNNGGVILMPYGLEAFAPTKHLKKENGKAAEVDETLEFKVLEFDRGNKKIIVSHSRVHDEKKAEEKKAEGERKDKERNDTRSDIKNINRKVEKSTLGEIGGLAELKQKLEQGSDSAAAETAEPETTTAPEASTETSSDASSDSSSTEEPKAE